MRVRVRVAIAGGGLGGLCLAQRLHARGIAVAVHERDAAIASRPQGYRLHLDGRGAAGLHQCLPPALYELALATAGVPSTQIAVLTTGLRQLGVMRGEPRHERAHDPGTVNTAVDRRTLREILLGGLEDVVHFGSAVSGYDCDHDETRVREPTRAPKSAPFG